MQRLVSVSQAAELLSLDPQTIYRKIKRGELPVVRMGRTIRVALPEMIEQPQLPLLQPVPEFIFRLLWDADKSKVRSDSPQVLERILDLGDVGDVAWLFATRPRYEILQFLSSRRARRLSKRSLAFWCDYFGVSNEGNDSVPGTAKTLGETEWR